MSRPNILLITTDQQRYDTTGPAAPPFLRTPHFDHLAREGITFSRAYTDCPICVPARCSIMSGQNVFTHGMANNGPTSRALQHQHTLPAYLHALGYHTAAIGKMHFTPQRARHGFDEMLLPDDYYRWLRDTGSPQQPMRHGLGQNELYPGMATVPESLTLTSWIAEQCVGYIRDRRDPTMPFFLWCSFSKPHPPLDPPEPYYSMYRQCAIPEPVFGDWSSSERMPEAFKRAQQQWSNDLIPPEVIREARAAYYGLITQIDYNMGRIFAALQDVKLFDETLILYCSDHGEYLGDHHAGSKSFFHEPSAHVPMVLRLPQHCSDRRHGTVCEQLVTLADIVPTLVTAAGGDVDPRVDGQDLIALARGELEAPRQQVVATVGNGEGSKYLATTTGRWKYIHWIEGPSEQLFDLENDPHELRDLAAEAEHDAMRQQMRAALVEWLRDHAPAWLDGDDLPQRPVTCDSLADRRSRPWPGYHTETHDADVRH